MGGVPEVLPPDMAVLVEPEPEALVEGVEDGLARLAAVQRAWPAHAWAQHQRVAAMYDWQQVAARTSKVRRLRLQPNLLCMCLSSCCPNR